MEKTSRMLIYVYVRVSYYLKGKCNETYQENPRDLQTTLASTSVHPNLQTVPHEPFRYTSTLPSSGVEPPTSRVVMSTKCLL